MSRITFAMVAWSAMLASAAFAGGINVAWTECLGGGGTMARSFACNTNAGSNTIVASFIPDTNLDDVTGMVGIIDLCTGGFALPPWWTFLNPGSCRPHALITGFDPMAGGCADAWQGQMTGLTTYMAGFPDWNSARILVDATLTGPVPVSNDTEYYGFTIRILNTDSAGSPSCAGCTMAACIVLNEIELRRADGSSQRLQYPVGGFGNMLNWQGFIPNCPFVVPVANPTWGRIKSQYR